MVGKNINMLIKLVCTSRKKKPSFFLYGSSVFKRQTCHMWLRKQQYTYRWNNINLKPYSILHNKL